MEDETTQKRVTLLELLAEPVPAVGPSRSNQTTKFGTTPNPSDPDDQ
jgi:hypothetical protein